MFGSFYVKTYLKTVVAFNKTCYVLFAGYYAKASSTSCVLALSMLFFNTANTSAFEPTVESTLPFIR